MKDLMSCWRLAASSLGCPGKLRWAALCFLLLAGGCATRPRQFSPPRQFVFEKDTFAFANEIEKEHFYNAKGEWVGLKRDPKPDYSQHCFVVSRSVLQFFEHARFAPELPKADDATYRKLIGKVVDIDPRNILPDNEKIVIPGYADLRSFSRENEKLLKEECGGAWQSYVQRGHWRMIFPFTRMQERKVAGRLLDRLNHNQPAVVHLVRFPQLSINHGVLIFGARKTENGIEFKTYDPNKPEAPTTISYKPREGTFMMAANDYFPGGRIDLYEIYHGIIY
jgi:hypothetical protein